MKKLLIILGFLLLIPTAYAATVISGQQVNRVWPSSNVNGQQGLQIIGTAASRGLSASGVVTVGGKTVLQSTLKIGGVTYTFPWSDGAASGKVLATNSAGQLSWSTGGTSNAFGTGNVITIGNSRYQLIGGYLASSTGSLRALFNTLYLQTSTGSLKSYFLGLNDARYVNTSGDTMTGSLLVKAAISGASLRVSNLKICDTIDTDINGNLTCGTDATNFGTGNVLTIGNARYQLIGGYLASSTGSLTNYLKSISMFTSTGALQTKFSTIYQPIGGYLQSSTGSLKTLFLANNDARYLRTSGGTMTGTLNLSGSAINVSGNISQPAWTTNGLRFKVIPATLTDTTSVGVVPSAFTSNFGGNTIAATNATTFTDYSAVKFTGPTAGTNVTLTNGWAILTDSIKIGTTTSAVRVLTNGRVGIGKNAPATALDVIGTISGSALQVSGLIGCTNLQTSAAGVVSCNSSAYQTTALTDDSTWVGSSSNIATATAIGLCTGAGKALTYDTSANSFGCNTISGGSAYAAGQGLTLNNGNLFTLNSSNSGSLSAYTTQSGASVLAKRYLSSSGVLVVNGTVTLKSLPSCTNVGTSSTGLASCNGAVYLQSSTGSLLAMFTNIMLASSTGSLKTYIRSLADARYIRTSGGTATGTLTVRAINESGALTITRGSTFGINTGTLLSVDNKGLNYDGTNKRVGILQTAPETALDVAGTISGGLLNLSNRGTSYALGSFSVGKSTNTAALDVFGTMSGSAVTVSGKPSCNFLQTSTIGALTCVSSPQREIILSAGGATPTTGSGSVAKNVNFTINKINVQTQDFTSSGATITTHSAQWTALMPTSYDGLGITAKFEWFTPNVAGTARWYIQCLGYANTTAMDTAFGTSGSVLSTANATANVMLISGATGTITCGGTPAGGNPMMFRVFRRAKTLDGADTLAGTGRLVNVKIRYGVTTLTE